MAQILYISLYFLHNILYITKAGTFRDTPKSYEAFKRRGLSFNGLVLHLNPKNVKFIYSKTPGKSWKP